MKVICPKCKMIDEDYKLMISESTKQCIQCSLNDDLCSFSGFVKICECGSESLKSPRHSDWCPKYEKE